MKKRLSFILIFVLFLTALPTHTYMVTAATKDIDSMSVAELNQLIKTLSNKKTSQMTPDELDRWGHAHWALYVLENKAEWDKQDSTFTANGVELPRPRDVWALNGYPYNYGEHDAYVRAVKMKSTWDVYLKGAGSNHYHLSITNNMLKITGENNIDSLRHVYSVRGKFQLFKPTKGLDCYVGDDGLAYVDKYSYDRNKFIKNTPVISSNTIILSPDEAEGQEAVKDLSFEMDLSNLSDGIYCIQELVSNLAPDRHDASLYWWELLIVVYEGKASLQAMDNNFYPLPKAPEGRVSYDKWWANGRSCSYGDYLCTHY